MVATLQKLFGDDPGITLSVVIFDPLTMSNITRRWQTFSEAVEEVIDGRIYAGFHFRTSDEVGARLGRQVAQFAMKHALRPCRGRGARCAPRE